MKIRNFILAILDQGPGERFIKNFFITRNAWGLFHKNSHVAQSSGKLKVMYNTRATAVKAADSLSKKYDRVFRPYKCIWCDGFHIGSNRR